MRIISKHRDYYDSAAAYGVDTTRTYMRNQYEVPESAKSDVRKALDPLFQLLKKLPYEDHYNAKFPVGWDVKCFIIAFCGKAQLGIRVIKYATDRQMNYAEETYKEFFYSAQGYRDFINDKAPTVLKKYFHSPNRFWGDSIELRNDRLNYLFNKVEAFKGDGLFHAVGDPVILLHRGGLGRMNQREKAEINPTLKDWGFVKVKDPFTAFQEIDMYLSGVLGCAHPPMIEVGNDVKIAKHGFNDKSFRKAPGQKRRRRRKK